MSIENIDIFKFNGYFTNAKTFLEQYESRLSFLKSSRDHFISYYEERDSLDDDIRKRLSKLNKSIVELETEINNFKNLYNL